MADKPIFEAEFTQGLDPFVYQEIRKAGGKFIKSENDSAGVVRFKSGKSLMRLLNLRVVSRLFRVHSFDVPRPKALLGQQHLDRICAILKQQVQDLGKGKVKNFRLEAAGKESAVFQRLIAQLEQRLNLPHDDEGGDLFIRIKPTPGDQAGWELLVRPTVRPLAVRSWRQFNYPGALSAPIAAAMLQLAEIQPGDQVLNVMSGSATLQAEADESGALWANCDLDLAALTGARLNLQAAGKVAAQQQQASATAMPFQDSSFDVILCDLPWGQLVGESADMTQLYAQTMYECGRVAKLGGRLLIVTQLKRRFLNSLDNTPWELNRTIDLKHENVAPTIYALTRI